MSTEWILAVGIAAAGLVVGIITLVNVAALRRTLRSGQGQPVKETARDVVSGAVETGNVFCRSCGQMYDSAHTACPSCHTPRN